MIVVSLRYREIITVKTVALCQLNFFVHEKSRKHEKEANPNFVLLSQSRNMIGQFVKPFLHRPVKTLPFLTLGRIQKCLT